jgi:hypothetical protein
MDNASFEIAKLGIASAQALAQQLITLSTGILALTITFTKDTLKAAPRSRTWPLYFAWVSYLLCICFGVWALSTITGTLAPLPSSGVPPSLTIDSNIRLPAGLQVIAFIIGIILIVIFGAISFRKQAKEVSDADIGKD